MDDKGRSIARKPEIKHVIQNSLDQDFPEEHIRKKLFRAQGRCETCGNQLGWIARLKGDARCAKHLQPVELELKTKRTNSSSAPLIQPLGENQIPEKNCQKCGYHIQPGELYCRICGFPVPAQPLLEKPAQIEAEISHPNNGDNKTSGICCQKCGHSIQQGELFCRKCGAPLVTQLEFEEGNRAASNLLAQQNEIAVTPDNKCTLCGHLTQPGELFCRICGTSTTEQAVRVEPACLTVESKPEQEIDFRSASAQPLLFETNQLLDVTAKIRPLSTEETQLITPSNLNFEVRFSTGATKIFNSAVTLSEAIHHGAITKSLKARTITTTSEGKRKGSKWSNVEKVAVSNDELRYLYRPIWDYTLKFIIYGIYAGCALKALDTTVTLFTIDTLVGFFWLAVLGSLVIGNKIPYAPMVVIIGSVLLGLKINLFFAVLATMLVGAIFGTPFGMIVGTIVGFFRKNSRRVAPDAPSEFPRTFLLGILMPLIILAVIIPLYLWLNTKLAEWLF